MDTYRIGTAATDITPPIGMPYLAWKPRHQPFKGVNDPLLARAACIEADGEAVIVISADTIGFADTVLGPGRSFVGEIKQGIERRTGVPASHVMLASNHIHSSAETLDFRALRDWSPEALSWLGELRNRLVACAVDSRGAMRHVRLKIGTGIATGLVRNRRGDDCIDEEVTVLLFETERRPALVIVNYACHPVIMQVQEMASADYVGVLTRTVEMKIPSLNSCMFLLGACGDINPIMGDTRDYADSQMMGRALADEVVRLVGMMLSDEYPAEPAIVRAASERVEFPSRPLPSEDELPHFDGDDEAQARIREGSGPFAGEVQVIRIGGALLAGMPGEIFCSTGRQVKKLCAPLTGIPVGYANGYLGYFAPPEAWEKGGYEVNLGPWSKVGHAAAGMLLDALRRVAEPAT